MEISGFRNLDADLIGEGEYWGVDEMECSLYEMNEQAMMELKPYSSQVGDYDRPLKQMRSTATHWSSPYSHTPPTTATSFNFNFASTSTPSNPKHQAFVLKSSTSTHHSLAERKRREKISQSFMDLSALLPGLKKMDRTSVLEDAIEYMKELEAKVKRLEEKAKTKTMSMESVRFTINKDDDDGGGEKSVMEARFGEKELFISIECEARKGVFERVVGEVEKHHLSLLNTSVLTYGNSSLSITLIAQKNEESGNVSMEQLVRNLQDVVRAKFEASEKAREELERRQAETTAEQQRLKEMYDRQQQEQQEMKERYDRQQEMYEQQQLLLQRILRDRDTQSDM